jgi:wyosine [tRNA(Phe)-imidazoG37] synthetase (radical SAM superfamily)
MGTFLFDKIIFGPIKSRRLGSSLGVNLLYQNSKLCNYDCVYCECGWSENDSNDTLPALENVSEELEKQLQLIKLNNQNIDVITFAGNGEPTLHSEFLEIINETIRLRNKYFAKVKIAVLTNATNLGNPNVVEALNKIDMPILKIDTINQFDYEKLNRPLNTSINIRRIIDQIILKIEKPIIQTMFLKAWFGDYFLDNTNEKSLSEYFNAIKEISPELVMLYSIARDTPMQGLQKIDMQQLQKIGKCINEMGIETLITP